jgi:nickel/cobalt exporter
MIQLLIRPMLVRLLLMLAVIVPATTVSADRVFAQTPSPQTTSPKGFLPPSKAAERPSGVFAWILAKQAEINRRLAAAVRDIKTGDPLFATLVLAALSFAYGVLHAAGPGHGKAVIASYVLANEQTVRRGIALSFLAALFQGLSALIIVGILVLVLRSTSLTMKATEGWLETISWGMVAAIGAWLLYTQIKDLMAQRALRATGEHAHHDHGHDHAHHHAPHREVALETAGHGHRHAPHDHHHGHRHDHGDHAHTHHTHDHVHLPDGSCCGHAHMPDPSELQGPWSWRRALAIAVAVGIRPCTGAILVLVFSIGQGLMWAGVFATFAMAIGTAITVSVLAALAVGSRELALRIGGGRSSTWGAYVRTAAGLGSAALILGLGLVLMIGSFYTTTVF